MTLDIITLDIGNESSYDIGCNNSTSSNDIKLFLHNVLSNVDVTITTQLTPFVKHLDT